MGEGGAGEGADVAHVAELVRGGGRFVKEDAADVDVLLGGAGAAGPVLVGGDLGFEGGEVLRPGADPVLVRAAIVPRGGVHVR